MRARSPSSFIVTGTHASVPSVIGIPATATLSLIHVGTPAK
jgi:hypothetical protein